MFDLRMKDRVQIQVKNHSKLPCLPFGPYNGASNSQIMGNLMEGRILFGETPGDLIREYTASIGRMKELPDWAISGAIVGVQGGSDKVKEVWSQLKEHGTPLSAFWLQVCMFESAGSDHED